MIDVESISVQEEREALNAVIEHALTKRLEESRTVAPHYHELWAEVARLLRSGGKRLRSRMVVLSYEMFGGTDVKAILPAAAAQEFLHMSMLIHDDIIDRDYTRYGVDNVAGSYAIRYGTTVADTSDRMHYSHSAAMLAGDLLLSEAYLLMAESAVDANTVLAVQKLMGRGIFEVVGGELLDTESVFRGEEAALAETIALNKTASYTFVLPLLVGAELAGAPSEQKTLVAEFARYVGIAFQLRDDVLGVFGDQQQTGKTITGDIREGKRTYMVEQFYQLATPEQSETFSRYFGKGTIGLDEAAIVSGLFIQSGALNATERRIGELDASARQMLTKLTINDTYSRQLSDLVTAATKRNK